MIWRRIAEMFGYHRPAEVEQERSARAEELAVLEAATKAQTRAVREMSNQTRTGVYHRIRAEAVLAQKRVGR